MLARTSALLIVGVVTASLFASPATLVGGCATQVELTDGVWHLKCSPGDPATTPCDHVFEEIDDGISFETCACAGQSTPECCHAGIIWVEGSQMATGAWGFCWNSHHTSCKHGECLVKYVSTNVYDAHCQ